MVWTEEIIFPFNCFSFIYLRYFWRNCHPIWRLFTLTIWNLKEIGQSNILATETNLICNVSSERLKIMTNIFKKKNIRKEVLNMASTCLNMNFKRYRPYAWLEIEETSVPNPQPVSQITKYGKKIITKIRAYFPVVFTDLNRSNHLKSRNKEFCISHKLISMNKEVGLTTMQLNPIIKCWNIKEYIKLRIIFEI